MLARTPAELGALVRQHRQRRGWTQEELAKRAGTSRQWIVGLEAGRGRAELGLVMNALQALDLFVDLVPRDTTVGREAVSGPVDLDEVLAAVRRDV